MTEVYPPPETPSPELPDLAMERAYVSRQTVPLADLGCFPMQPHARNWKTWLRESGELVLAVSAEPWLFLWMVDTRRAEVHTRVAWPLGEWLSDGFEIVFWEETLWVIAHHNLIEISCQDWRVRSCRCFLDFATEGAIIESSMMVPGSPYLWVRTSLPEATFLVEIESWTVYRHLNVGDSLLTLVAGPDPLVCVTSSKERSVLYQLDGTPLPGGDLQIDYIMDSMARTPLGPGLLTLNIKVDDEDLLGINDLSLEHLAPADSGSFELIDELSCMALDDEGGAIFVSRDQGLCYVLLHVAYGQRVLQQLMAVSVSEGGGSLAISYEVSVPDDLVLAQNPQNHRVVAIFTGERGLNVLPIGRQRPSLDHLPGAFFDRSRLVIPKLEVTSCGRCLGINQDRVLALLAKKIRQLKPDQLGDFIELSKTELQGEVEMLICIYYALDTGETHEDAELEKELERQRDEVHRLLREEYAEQPAAALLFADLEARAGRWPEVRRHLRGARPDDFQDSRRGHLMHLEGLALTREGRCDEAFELFSKARGYEDISTPERHEKSMNLCELDDLELLTRPMANPPAAHQWDEGQPLLRQLLGAMRTADGCRAAGDAEAALAALDRPIFWQTGEVQWAARQAELFLEKPDGGADLFQKRFVLAHCREAFRDRLGHQEIHLPGLTWDRERIERIDEQARAWLDQQRRKRTTV